MKVEIIIKNEAKKNDVFDKFIELIDIYRCNVLLFPLIDGRINEKITKNVACKLAPIGVVMLPKRWHLKYSRSI